MIRRLHNAISTVLYFTFGKHPETSGKTIVILKKNNHNTLRLLTVLRPPKSNYPFFNHINLIGLMPSGLMDRALDFGSGD